MNGWTVCQTSSEIPFSDTTPMDEWMDGWMNEWMNERYANLQAKFRSLTHQWMNGWMDGWMNEWMIKWMNERMIEWMNKWTVCQASSEIPFSDTTSMDEWMDGWMNEWMNVKSTFKRNSVLWHNTTRGTGTCVSSEQYKTTLYSPLPRWAAC